MAFLPQPILTCSVASLIWFMRRQNLDKGGFMRSVNILAEQETSGIKDSELYPLLQEYAETLSLAEQVNERLLNHCQNLLEENKSLAAAKEELLQLSAKELYKKETKLRLIQQELRHIK